MKYTGPINRNTMSTSVKSMYAVFHRTRTLESILIFRANNSIKSTVQYERTRSVLDAFPVLVYAGKQYIIIALPHLNISF